MDQGLIPHRYARALYKVALERHCDEALYGLMLTLARSFESQPKLNDAIANPYLEPAAKEKLVLAAAGVTADDSSDAITTLIDFLKLLEKNRRIAFARETVLAYISIYRNAHHIAQVTVSSASKLDEDSTDRLRKIISDHTPGYSLEYTFNVDPDLIGGFTIAIDNSRLDASIKNELKQLRLKLLSK